MLPRSVSEGFLVRRWRSQSCAKYQKSWLWTAFGRMAFSTHWPGWIALKESMNRHWIDGKKFVHGWIRVAESSIGEIVINYLIHGTRTIKLPSASMLLSEWIKLFKHKASTYHFVNPGIFSILFFVQQGHFYKVIAGVGNIPEFPAICLWKRIDTEIKLREILLVQNSTQWLLVQNSTQWIQLFPCPAAPAWQNESCLSAASIAQTASCCIQILTSV